MFRTKVSVRYGETDKMGVVYHARYFPWFEIGREEYLKSFGITYADAEKDGLMLPLVDCYARFFYGARYGDELWVEVQPEKLGAVRCKFSYRILRVSDEKLLASGYTTHCFTNTDIEPINIKKVYPEYYKILCQMSGDIV